MRPPPRGVTTTTPPLGIELQIQKVARVRARARARVFFQDCVILPGGVERLGHLTQQSHATNARNARTQQTRSTQNKIRKHAKSRTTAENIAYRTNQRPLRA